MREIRTRVTRSKVIDGREAGGGGQSTERSVAGIRRKRRRSRTCTVSCEISRCVLDEDLERRSKCPSFCHRVARVFSPPTISWHECRLSRIMSRSSSRQRISRLRAIDPGRERRDLPGASMGSRRWRKTIRPDESRDGNLISEIRERGGPLAVRYLARSRISISRPSREKEAAPREDGRPPPTAVKM